MEVWRVCCWFGASTRREARGLGGFKKVLTCRITTTKIGKIETNKGQIRSKLGEVVPKLGQVFDFGYMKFTWESLWSNFRKYPFS